MQAVAQLDILMLVLCKLLLLGSSVQLAMIEMPVLLSCLELEQERRKMSCLVTSFPQKKQEWGLAHCRY
jgi:hypothetical protein